MSNARMTQSINRLAMADDPKQAIVDEIGEAAIDGYRLFDDDLLLATYIRPEKTKGGIYLIDKTKEEDRFQGKVGLLLKSGPTAWKYDRSGSYAFEGEAAQSMDWVVYRASEGWEISINGVSCRLVSSKNIRGRVADPTVIW